MVSNKDKANSDPRVEKDDSTAQPTGIESVPVTGSSESPPSDEHGSKKPISAAEDGTAEPDRIVKDAEIEPYTVTGEAQAPAAAPAPAPLPAKPGRALATIAVVLAVAAFAASGYMWYRYEVQQKHAQEIAAANLFGELKGVTESTRALEKQQDKLASEQSKLASEQSKLASAQGDLGTSIQEKLGNSVSELQQRQEELTTSVSKVYESLDRSIDSWALEEIEQLLRMANHSVALAGDVAMAATALELADKRLDQLGNPEYLEIRRFIADEVTQLKAVEQVDLPGLAFRLSSLAASVNELALASEPDHSIATGGDTAAATEDNIWLDAGRALLSDLQGLVRVQNVTEPAKPLLSPEQRYYLVANLRLLLSGAQIAVLRTDTQTYQANLSQASKWLSEYFDTEDSAVQSMITELNDMAGRDLTPERPNIAGSIAELQRIKQRMKSQ